MFLRCMRKRSVTGIVCVFELHSFMLLERYYVVMVLPFSDTLGQFAMVFVSIINDVQFCTVSIHMQGVPKAFGPRQSGSTCFQAGFLRETITDYLGQDAFQQAP